MRSREGKPRFGIIGEGISGMRNKRVEPMEHTKKHQELICSLVEEDLVGEEKLQAERNLLSCAECLAEYNSYRKFWRFLASPQLAQRREVLLKERNPERHRLYHRVQDQMTSSTPEPAKLSILASAQAW